MFLFLECVWMLNVGIDKINGIKLLFSHYSASLFIYFSSPNLQFFTVCASHAGYQNHLGYNIVKKLSTDCTHEVQFTVRRSDTQVCDNSCLLSSVALQGAFKSSKNIINQAGTRLFCQPSSFESQQKQVKSSIMQWLELNLFSC